MMNVKHYTRPDRSGPPALSSVATRFVTSMLLAGTALATSAAIAQVPQSATPSFPLVARPADPIANAVSEWRMLSQSGSYSFTSYANFLINHPGFPDSSAIRKNAERVLRADGEPAELVIAFFRRYPPLSATAGLRFAEALSARGLREEAKSAARNAWIGGALAPEDETRFFSAFADSILPSDHDLRMDRLLWDRATTAAARQLALVSPQRRAIFEARLAMLTKAPDAAAKSALVFDGAKNDAGFLADRNWWQRNTGQLIASRELLAAPRALVSPPRDPGKWLDILYVTAKAASNDGQFSLAYNIARQLPETYPVGTIVNERPFSERDTYTDLAWLGGQAAMTQLGRPKDAVALFNLYANAAQSAQTRAKGFYWAGRAAEVAGQQDLAVTYYTSAGAYFDQFHGQLALERLGKPIAPPQTARVVEISAAQREAFEKSPLVQAAKYLGAQGLWQEQTKFVRAIAAKATTDLDSILATELAQKINRPDLAVMIGRNARAAGLGDYLRTAFPQVQVPDDIAGSWTMIHAIARQESQFDRQIVSHAGARGLMQLMPGTARETASVAGLNYDPLALYDTTYNVRLGSTYFGQMMDRYAGSYVLAVAAYNAGPGNVDKWLRTIGDPRSGMDVLTWIERIPLSETRDYVQRVLENAVVYDMLNPRTANIKSPTPLSAYLGKSKPG
ncbi:lytic transglycosylase domain-containing protein [Aquisediminimonas profunda]|uniref:lytic transglycosylase domain-containing protein n=1 Tax=Aquisediminimonas profunda TaxID=1550733 RepID=UPI001FEC0386|nr:lytic transglycosylase domain-containing protein [Aquisediminimonas profunda]